MSDLREKQADEAVRRHHAQGLVDFLWASPSPFHAVDVVAEQLEAAGFVEVDEAGEPPAIAAGSKGFIRRAGAIVAWRAGSEAPASAGFRVAAAHTDSPNLRLKPAPDVSSEGYRQVGVEIYGGVLLHTWTDRDLGLSGRVMVDGDQGPEARLFRVDAPVARVANLAIHLNRGVNKNGIVLNPQKHMVPMVGVGEWDGLVDWLGEQLGGQKPLSWELGFHDTQPPTLGGIDEEFVFGPRLDNLGCCYTITQAMVHADDAPHTQVMALFDHEEIGSRTYRGAMGPMLRDILERVVQHHECTAPGGLARAGANSWMVSCDMAHGVHPNYADKHEPNHKPLMGGGPVLKGHVEHRYATEAETTARWRSACAAVGVPCQDFVNRVDLSCGSTVGPMMAAELGISTVDVGMAMLSMHSIREQAGAADMAQMIVVLQHIYEQG